VFGWLEISGGPDDAPLSGATGRTLVGASRISEDDLLQSAPTGAGPPLHATGESGRSACRWSRTGGDQVAAWLIAERSGSGRAGRVGLDNDHREGVVEWKSTWLPFGPRHIDLSRGSPLWQTYVL